MCICLEALHLFFFVEYASKQRFHFIRSVNYNVIVYATGNKADRLLLLLVD